MVAALATFSVPFLIRPLGGLSLVCWAINMVARRSSLSLLCYVDQYVLYWLNTVLRHDWYWAPILLLICKMAQGFSVGGEIPGRRYLLRNTPLTVNVALWQLAGLRFYCRVCAGCGRGGVISTIVGEANFLDWGWRIPFLLLCR